MLPLQNIKPMKFDRPYDSIFLQFSSIAYQGKVERVLCDW